MMHSPPRTTSGFSLVETIIATLIVGGLFAAALSAVAATRTTQIDTSQRTHGQMLAQDLLAEILAQPYTHDDAPSLSDSPNEAATRANFDAIAYYHRWHSTPPQTAHGQTLDAYDRYTRSAQVHHVHPLDPDRTTDTPTGAKRITVQVHRDQRLIAELTAIRTQAWHEPDPEDRYRLP